MTLHLKRVIGDQDIVDPGRNFTARFGPNHVTTIPPLSQVPQPYRDLITKEIAEGKMVKVNADGSPIAKKKVVAKPTAPSSTDLSRFLDVPVRVVEELVEEVDDPALLNELIKADSRKTAKAAYNLRLEELG